MLAESPSLWSGSGAFLDVMRSHAGPIAERVWLGSGTREFSVGGRDLAGCVRAPHLSNIRRRLVSLFSRQLLFSVLFLKGR